MMLHRRIQQQMLLRGVGELRMLSTTTRDSRLIQERIGPMASRSLVSSFIDANKKDNDDDAETTESPSFDENSGSGENHSQRWNKFPDVRRFWKPIQNSSRKQRPIFVAATRQHVGKTTTSLAIMSGLQKRYDKVGFLKPVGQQHVQVQCQRTDESIRVDKDCVLVREHFHLDHIDYGDMSPVSPGTGHNLLQHHKNQNTIGDSNPY